MLSVVLLVCLLTACADDSSDRQFAGDEQSTAAPTATQPPFPTSVAPASPASVPTAMADDELFALRGAPGPIAFIIDRDLYLSDSAEDAPHIVDIDEQWTPWLADVSDDGHRIAVLVSPRQSTNQWKMLILTSAGEIEDLIAIVGSDGSPAASTEIVTTGTGGVDWSPTGDRIAVALPTGGIYAVTPEGDVGQMASPKAVARPGDLAWSHDGHAIAYTSKPDARSGLGIYVAPAAALPLDPVTILTPDPTGNRSAREVLWTHDNDKLIAIIERRETGGTGGDVLSVPSSGGPPNLIWSSGMHSVDSGAKRISLSSDGQVLAIISSSQDDEAVAILHQLGGTTEVRQELGVAIDGATIAWTDEGLRVAGGTTIGEQLLPVSVNIGQDGDPTVSMPAPASPVPASPVASPVAIEPDATPMSGSPVASPIPASPVASPHAATPEGSPPSSTDS